MEHETSPWGRLKKCGNHETCKEFKDRILERTIFMTPTGANEEVSVQFTIPIKTHKSFINLTGV